MYYEQEPIKIDISCRTWRSSIDGQLYVKADDISKILYKLAAKGQILSNSTLISFAEALDQMIEENDKKISPSTFDKDVIVSP